MTKSIQNCVTWMVVIRCFQGTFTFTVDMAK